jgi:hypothetical protein
MDEIERAALHRYCKIHTQVIELCADALGLSGSREYCLLKELREAKAARRREPFDCRNAQWVADVEDRLIKVRRTS